MFDEIGKKIKTVASVICAIGIISSLALALWLIFTGETAEKVIGIFVAGFGIFFSWFGTLTLYGYGEIIEKLTEI